MNSGSRAIDSLLTDLSAAGLELAHRREEILFRPKSAMTPALAERVTRHRAGILAALRARDERSPRGGDPALASPSPRAPHPDAEAITAAEAWYNRKPDGPPHAPLPRLNWYQLGPAEQQRWREIVNPGAAASTPSFTVVTFTASHTNLFCKGTPVGRKLESRMFTEDPTSLQPNLIAHRPPEIVADMAARARAGLTASDHEWAGWSEAARETYVDRLAVADDLGMDTGPGSEAEAVARREARRVEAKLPGAWHRGRDPDIFDHALAAFAPLGGLTFVSERSRPLDGKKEITRD